MSNTSDVKLYSTPLTLQDFDTVGEVKSLLVSLTCNAFVFVKSPLPNNSLGDHCLLRLRPLNSMRTVCLYYKSNKGVFELSYNLL